LFQIYFHTSCPKTAGADFTSISRTYTFTALVTSATVTVPIINDEIYEQNEDFIASLSQEVSSNFTVFAPATTAILILDNEGTRVREQDTTMNTFPQQCNHYEM